MPCKSKLKGVKAKEGFPSPAFFSVPPYGESAAHDDGLHLSPWFCDYGVSRYAHRVARSPSPHPLLADLHASRAPGAKNLGRDGQVDARHHHRMALWAPAQSGLLERASARQLVRAGSLGHLATASEWHPVSVWRRQSCRQTRYKNPVGQK